MTDVKFSKLTTSAFGTDINNFIINFRTLDHSHDFWWSNENLVGINYSSEKLFPP